MKNLENKILKKIYFWETRKITFDLFLKIIVFLSNFLFFLILGEILFEVLKEQKSFELLNFFHEDFEVVKKYFFDNVFIFWLEVPKFLLLSLFLSLGISSTVILLVIKNFKIYKNKIKNLYQWFLKQK
jgi:hypothetical protein